MEKNGTNFKYTYSASQQEEIKRIRQKYQPQEEDNMAKLRKLDASATKKATSMSLAIGIVGALTLGLGMSLILTDVGVHFGLQNVAAMVVGILLGIPGIALVGVAYPMYNKILKDEREKIAPEIIRLTDELLR